MSAYEAGKARTMTEGLKRTTAKIYQFPDRRRRKLEEEAAVLKPALGVTVVYGGSWYHEEALRETGEPERFS